MEAKTLEQLVNNEQPAWPLVQEWIEQAKNQVEILPASREAREEALLGTQVTTRSPMGAIIYETGGLLIDHGWIRILGAHSDRMPRSLPLWNKAATDSAPGEGPFLLIADDVTGGFFALDNGGISGNPGHVSYFSPTDLEWQDLELTYSEFLLFCLNGNLSDFYQGMRWDNWQDEVSGVSGDKAFNVYPPPYTETTPYGERNRKAVPLKELYKFIVVDSPAHILKMGLKPGQVVPVQIKSSRNS
jgi:hypothetical protein